MVNHQHRQVVYLPVTQLQFDPQNPRLPSRLNSKNDEDILEFMIRRANVIELMGSIGEGGYFIGEPLLVVKVSGEDKYDVIEGNRRLAAVKLLLEPHLASVRASSIHRASSEAKNLGELQALPSLIFEDRNEILTYLGYRHITGIQSWGALAKARYLQQLLILIDEQDDTDVVDRTLAKEIGSRADYVGCQLASVAVYDRLEEADYFDIAGLNEETIDFAVLATALGYSNIVDFIGMQSSRDRQLATLNLAHLEELLRWIFEKDSEKQTVLGESRNLKMLNDVVAFPDALKSLRKGSSLADAYLLTSGPTTVFRESISSAKSYLTAAWNTFRSVSAPSPEDSEVLREIVITARRLRDLIEQAIKEPDTL